jgi:Glycosyl transferases group 1
MRILSVVRRNYYGVATAIEPLHLYFTMPLREMGHDVETFDHYEMSRTVGRGRATLALADKIRKGEFDVVFYQTSGQEPVETAALADLSRKFCIAAWNSDDDWQWETTRQIAAHFTFMITTYPHVHEQNHFQYSNLLLSQWGCPGLLSGHGKAKDIEFSFAGSIYGERNKACRYLRRKTGLACFGRGSRMVRLGIPYFRGAFKFPWFAGTALEIEGVYDVWNRSRISYTPLEGSSGQKALQIKSRIFEMGLTGTMVLCEQHPVLERYFKAGAEIITFESLEDCAEKALWYLAHEGERAKITDNYRDRTLREHMWTHRLESLFEQMGLKRGLESSAELSSKTA